MVRRSPQGQKRFDALRLEHTSSTVELTQADYQSLSAMLRGSFGNREKRKKFASQGLLSSEISRRAVVTEKGHRSLKAYETKIGLEERGVKTTEQDPEERREAWYKRQERFSKGHQNREMK